MEEIGLEGRSFGGVIFKRKTLVCQNVLKALYTKDYNHSTYFHFLMRFATQKVKIPVANKHCLMPPTVE